MLLQYKNHRFAENNLDLICIINQILQEYCDLGYELTLRQTYYQLVSRSVIPNNEKSYKNIGNLISNARLAGMIDWDSIIDRTRHVRSQSHWDQPAEVIESAANCYTLDKWENQPVYCEVWVEKDALIDIVAQACMKLDVPYFSCRGYTSQTEMWGAAQRFIDHDDKPDGRYIFHLGDHDPSGIDMSRDIQEKMYLFGADVYVKRIALTMDQIEMFNPPPNPVKLTDKRCPKYMKQYGTESWELDALKPNVITDLITQNILQLRNDEAYQNIISLEQTTKNDLHLLHEHYNEAITYLKSQYA